nr:IS1 family transposase [Escherichia coli]
MDAVKYVGAKSRQLAVYAYDRLRKTVVAHVFGEHYGDAGASYEPAVTL